MGKNPFDDESLNIESKESSFSKPGTDSSNFPHEKYKTIRIRPSDYKVLKKYSFEQDMTMVEAISIAIDMLNKKEDK